MPILNVEGVTHWSIPVNDLEEAEEYYGELLGLAPVGRLGNNIMSCFNVGDHNILLCERPNPVDGPLKEDAGVHHSFTVSPETFELAVQGLPREKRRHRSFDVSSPGGVHRAGTVLIRSQRQPAGVAGPHLDRGHARAVVCRIGRRIDRDRRDVG